MTYLIRSLDKAYYETLWQTVEKKKAQRTVLRNIIGTRLDMINIKSILRLKKEEIREEDIRKFLIPAHRLSDEEINEMIIAENVRSAFHVISETIYGNAIREGLTEFEETNSLLTLEKELDEKFLKICRGITVSSHSLWPPCFHTYI